MDISSVVDTAEWLIITASLILLVFDFVLFLLRPLQRDKFLNLLFLLAPFLLLFSMSLLFYKIYNPPLEKNAAAFVLIGISIFILFFFYTLVSFFPFGSAFAVFSVFGALKKRLTQATSSFWVLLEKNRRRRFWIQLFILSLLTILLVVNLQIGVAVYQKYATIHNWLWYGVIILLFYIFLGSLLLLKQRKHEPEFRESDHQKKEIIRKSIENISIAAGIKTPGFKIISAVEPNAFSFQQKHTSVLYFTTGLLNSLDKDELEAVCAHQISKLFLGDLLENERRNALLDGIRFLGEIFLGLILLLINPLWLIIWLCVITFFSIGRLEKEEVMDPKSFTLGFIHFFNPPFVSVHFLADLFYFALVYEQDFYTDIMAIQLTRNPKGLYSALIKCDIENKRGIINDLSETYLLSYFISDHFFTEDAVPLRPSVEERKKLISTIDGTLQTSIVNQKNDETIHCPFCRYQMETVETPVLYADKKTRIDRCLNCGGVWFDHLELYSVADHLSLYKLPKEAHFDNRGLTPKTQSIICPRCGINITGYNDPAIPKSIFLFRCSGCKGIFLSHEDVGEYAQFRLKKQQS